MWREIWGDVAHLRVANECDPLEHRDCADDKGKVRGDAEGEEECNLGEICGELLEVDGLGAAAGEGGVEDAREGGHDRRRVGAPRDEVKVDEVFAN